MMHKRGNEKGSRTSLHRFIVSACFTFVSSYGTYLILIIVTSPMYAYLVAYGVGLLSGNILHIRFTHRRRLTLKNISIQSGIQIGMGVVAAFSNSYLSLIWDPYLSGLTIIVVVSTISFVASRFLLR